MGDHVDSTKPPPGWTASSHGTIARPLDLVENWLHDRARRPGVLPHREPDAITQCLKLKFPKRITDPTPYLERAWSALVHVYPIWHALYPPFSKRGPDGGPSITLAPLDAAGWLRETFHVNEGPHAIFDDIDAAVRKFPAAPTPSAHWFPSSSHFLIRSGHLRVDGVGILSVTDTLFNLVASVCQMGLDVALETYASGIQKPALPPGIDHILGLKPIQGPTPKYVEDAIRGLEEEWRKGMKSITFPLREGSEGAKIGDSRQHVLAFDEPISKAIAKACTGLGVSVSAAVHASIIRVALTFPQHPEAKNILITLIVNLRHLLPTKYHAPEYRTSPCCYIVPACITDIADKSKHFGELAKLINGVYQTDLTKLATDEAGKPINFLEFLQYYREREAQILDAEPPADCPPFHPPNLSSVGILEWFTKFTFKLDKNSDETVEIEDLWAAIEMVDPVAEFQLYTIRNKMRLALSFNDAYYEEDFMWAIIGKVRDDLLKELGIPSGGYTARL